MDPIGTAAPGARPGEAEPRTTKRGVGTGAVVAVVLGILAFCCVVPGVMSAVTVLVPRIQAKQRQNACADHLRELGTLWIADWFAFVETGARDDVPLSGPDLLRSWRDAGRVAADVLRCPADPGPGDCSYAVRDFDAFPLPEGHRVNAIAACIHHGGAASRSGVLLVLGDDGAVHAYPLEDRTPYPADGLRVGPDSPTELLQPLIAPGGD